MVKLDNTSSAWFNYFLHLQARMTNDLVLLTPESMSHRLSEYNGLVIDHNNSSGWQPYFKTDRDMMYFVLKWA